MTNIDSLKAQVEHCLVLFPNTRNSDVELTLRVWREYYSSRIKYSRTNKEYVYLDDIKELPREDTIKRIRADFNSQGMYYPTSDEVRKARRINEDKWRKAMARRNS